MRLFQGLLQGKRLAEVVGWGMEGERVYGASGVVRYTDAHCGGSAGPKQVGRSGGGRGRRPTDREAEYRDDQNPCVYTLVFVRTHVKHDGKASPEMQNRGSGKETSARVYGMCVSTFPVLTLM
jgi:hypothetical protein